MFSVKRRATYIPSERDRRLGVIGFWTTIVLAVTLWGGIITALINGWVG